MIGDVEVWIWRRGIKSNNGLLILERRGRLHLISSTGSRFQRGIYIRQWSPMAAGSGSTPDRFSGVGGDTYCEMRIGLRMAKAWTDKTTVWLVAVSLDPGCRKRSWDPLIKSCTYVWDKQAFHNVHPILNWTQTAIKLKWIIRETTVAWIRQWIFKGHGKRR